MKKIQLNIILDFLEDWPTDESLISPFINNIKGGRYVDGFLYYLPNDDILFADFWSKHIASYIHFYVYAMIQKWSSETSSDIVLHRKKSFVNHFMDDIVEEMNGLLLHLCDEKSSNSIVVKYFVENSANTLFDEFVGNGLLLVTICKNEELRMLSQKYFAFLCHHIEGSKPQILLSSLSNLLSSYNLKDYNNHLGRSVLKIIVDKLAKVYSYSDFENISKRFYENTDIGENIISQLKDATSLCLKYNDASKFCIDGIALGFTKFKDALAIKENNNIKGEYSYSSCHMEYKGAIISFEYDFDDEENGKCSSIQLFKESSNEDSVYALNYFLGILFNIRNFDYKDLSYNDFFKLLGDCHFFELQKFHPTSKDQSDYSVKWRQVTPAYICDFIFSIKGKEGMRVEDVKKNIKDINISLDIYINDKSNQENLYKTEPVPSLESDYSSFGSGSSTSSFEYEYNIGDWGLIG